MARDLGAPYSEEKPFYFISYNSDDVERVRKYAIKLSEYGIPLWYDKGLKVGDEWEIEIATRVDDCQAVIMFLSKNIFRKKESYVYKEFELATEYSKKKVYVVMLDKIAKPEVPVRFRPWWISVTKSQYVCTYEETTLEESIKLLIEGLKTLEKKNPEETSTFAAVENKNVGEQMSSVKVDAAGDNFTDVEKTLQTQKKLLEQKMNDLGENHPETLKAMTNVAVTLIKMRCYEEASQLTEKVFELSSDILGENHPATITAMNNLAHTYDCMGWYERALELHKRVYDGNCNILGIEHPATIVAMNNLAIIYSNMGKLREALELYIRVYEQRCKMLGEDHPDTLQALSNLAIGYADIGEIRKAVKLQERAYKLISETFGEEHAEAARALDILNKMREML